MNTTQTKKAAQKHEPSEVLFHPRPKGLAVFLDVGYNVMLHSFGLDGSKDAFIKIERRYIGALIDRLKQLQKEAME